MALPIDLLTSLAWRFSSSTSACLALRCASSATKRSTSAFDAAPRSSCDQVGIFNDESAIEHGIEIAIVERSTAIRDAGIRRSDFALAKLFPQVGAGFDAAMEVGQAEFFVGAVRVVVVQAPAQQQGIDSQQIVKGRHDRDRAPFAHEHRLRPKPCSIARCGGRHIRAVQRHHHARRAVHVDQFHLDARRAELAQACFERRGDLVRILIRHQAEAELGPGPRRQHRLGPFALIAAPQAVDVERRPGPAALERA